MLKLNIEQGVYKISFHKTKRVNTLIAELLREELTRLVSVPGRDVVLSLEGINFIDSSGFNAILNIVSQADKMGSRFRISNVSQETYELLNLMKINFVFEINPVTSKTLSRVM